MVPKFGLCPRIYEWFVLLETMDSRLTMRNVKSAVTQTKLLEIHFLAKISYLFCNISRKQLLLRAIIGKSLYLSILDLVLTSYLLDPNSQTLQFVNRIVCIYYCCRYFSNGPIIIAIFIIINYKTNINGAYQRVKRND